MFLHTPVLGSLRFWWLSPPEPIGWRKNGALRSFWILVPPLGQFPTGLRNRAWCYARSWNFYHTHFVADIQVIPGVSPIIVDTIPTTHPDDGDLEGQSLARKDECLLINKTQRQSGYVGLKVRPTDTHHCFDDGILIFSENFMAKISQILLTLFRTDPKVDGSHQNLWMGQHLWLPSWNNHSFTCRMPQAFTRRWFLTIQLLESTSPAALARSCRKGHQTLTLT